MKRIWFLRGLTALLAIGAGCALHYRFGPREKSISEAVSRARPVPIAKHDPTLEPYITQEKAKPREYEENHSSQSCDKEFDENTRWLFDAYVMLERHEGKRNWVYDDKTGKRLRPGGCL